MAAGISLLVPTHRTDRPLGRCLTSAARQMGPDDELIVIGDTHDGPLVEVENVVRAYGPRFRYVEHDAGHHCYGHCQLNLGLELASKPWIHCNDDDDVWSPTALAAMRAAIAHVESPRPVLFRFLSYHGLVFWDRPGRVESGHIGGHCLLAPNVRGRVGQFTCRYEGDFDWITDTLSRWQTVDPVWDPAIVAIARPQ